MSVVIRHRRRDRLSSDRARLGVGLGLILIVYVSVATYAALTLPVAGTADAKEHLDYIYQVSLGQLPAPFGHELEPERTGRQFASAHPPIYYWLMATLVGDLLPERIGPAVGIIRATNIGFGALTLAAIAWFGHQVGGRHRVALALGMALLAAGSFTMIRFGAEVYHDMLLTLAATLTLALATRMILSGRVTWITGTALALVSVIGLGTKATFIVTLAVAVGGLVLAGALRAFRGERRAGLQLIGVGVIATLAAIAANAWFYLINLERSGYLHRSVGKLPLQGRPEQSTSEVLVDPEFWSTIARGYIGRASGDFGRYATIAGIVIVVVLVLIGVIVVLRRLRRRTLSPTPWHWIIVLMMFLAVLGGQATQLSHASGFGAYNFRYFMPSLLAIVFFMAIGSAMIPRIGLLILAVAATILGVSNAVSCTLYAMKSLKLAELGPGTPLLIAEMNGIEPAFVATAVVLACLATAALLALAPLIQGAPKRAARSNPDERTENF